MRNYKIVIMLLCTCLAFGMSACSRVDVISATTGSDALVLKVGQSAQVPLSFVVNANVQDETVLKQYIDDLKVQWSVFDERVADVDEKGNITALMAGSTSITAYIADEDIFASVVLNVLAQPERFEVLDITLNTTSRDCPIDIKVYPKNAIVESIEYRLADSSIAVVQEGKVTATGAGTTELTVLSDKISATAKVTVFQAPNMISGEDIELRVGESTYVEVKPDIDTAEVGLTYTYSSEDKHVAFVETDGKVTAVGKGETVIRVWNELDQYCEVKVTVT